MLYAPNPNHMLVFLKKSQETARMKIILIIHCLRYQQTVYILKLSYIVKANKNSLLSRFT